MDEPIECCANCHFLVFQFRRGNEFDRMYLKPEDRAATRRNEFGWLESWPSEFALSCAQGVWDPGFHKAAESRFAVLVETERDACFFLPANRGMLMPAAERLQERRQALREAERDRDLTRRAIRQTDFSIRVAIAAVVVSSILQALSLGLQAKEDGAWPFKPNRPAAVGHDDVAPPKPPPISATSLAAESVK